MNFVDRLHRAQLEKAGFVQEGDSGKESCRLTV